MPNTGASKDLPTDDHLRQDVVPDSEAPAAGPGEEFTPGQTNAGQQVSGLASASGYGKDLDPEKQPDGNNPI